MKDFKRRALHPEAKAAIGAERKAFAAEVGRIIARMQENLQGNENCNLQNDESLQWIAELAKNTGTPERTIRFWWSSFCKETALDLTPKQAGAEEKARFFAWLDEQKAKEEAAKATKAAEQEAERKRKEEEATVPLFVRRFHGFLCRRMVGTGLSHSRLFC